MNEGLTEEDIPAPYSYFRHRVIDETITDADGNKTTHKKLSGFDGSYYIIRVDVSDIIDAGDVSTTNKQALEDAFEAAKQAIADAKQAIADANQAICTSGRKATKL